MNCRSALRIISITLLCSLAFASCDYGGGDCCDDPFTIFSGSALSRQKIALSGNNGTLPCDQLNLLT